MRYIANKKINRLTSTQKAYLAGIIDGEGSICITKAKNKKAGRLGYGYRPVVHVANTHSQVLSELQAWTGLGKARLFDDARENRKARWQWMIWSKQGEQLVTAVLPYLIIKKRQAELFIKFMQTKRGMGANGRTGLSQEQWELQDKIYQQMKILNT